MPPWQWQRRFLVLMGASTYALRMAGAGHSMTQLCFHMIHPSCAFGDHSAPSLKFRVFRLFLSKFKTRDVGGPKSCYCVWSMRGYSQPVSVVPPGASAAAVAAAVANGTAGGGALTDVAGSMGSMGSMKPTMDYGNQNSQGRGVNPWILN